jgi:hypothetical protein
MIFFIVAVVAIFVFLALIIYYLTDIDINTKNEIFTLAEIVLSWLMVVVLYLVITNVYIDYIEKAKNIQIFPLIHELELTAALYYAENGTWPQPFIYEENKMTSNYSALQLIRDGQILAIRENESKQLSFTPLIRTDQDGTENDSILWTCAYAKAPLAYSKSVNTSLTTIPISQLPNDCLH